MSDLNVSVVICTYRRPEMLRDAVSSLFYLATHDELKYEVIVIDNDPDKSAFGVVSQMPVNPDVPVRYVSHPVEGLSHARNRGIEEATGDMIAFLDDDVIVDKDWLSSMTKCMADRNADCVGGRTLIKWEGRPDPVLSRYVHDPGTEDFEFLGPVLPSGVNCIFKRDLFDEGLRFYARLGRVGQNLISGEDTEAFRRMLRNGKRIWYCATAVVHHRAAGERLKEVYYIRRDYWFGISSAVIDKRLHGKAYQVASACGRIGKALTVHVPHWAVGRVLRDPFTQFINNCALARQVGYIRGTLRIFS